MFPDRTACCAIRKKLYIPLFLLTVAAVGLGLWLLSHHRREPTFQGKPARYWFAGVADLTICPENAFKNSESFPVLLYALERRNSMLTKASLRLWPHLPGFLQKELPRPIDADAVRFSLYTALPYTDAATNALLEKEKLVLAAPVLIRALRDQDGDIRLAAASALEVASHKQELAEFIRPGIPDFIYLLRHDPDSNVRTLALGAIYLQGQSALAAVPALTAALHDSNTFVRFRAAVTLERIAPNTASAANLNSAKLPFLLNGLDDQRPEIRLRAAARINAFEKLAQPAVPALLTALNDKDQRVRHAVTNALKTIDPNVALKMGFQ